MVNNAVSYNRKFVKRVDLVVSVLITRKKTSKKERERRKERKRERKREKGRKEGEKGGRRVGDSRKLLEVMDKSIMLILVTVS